MRVRYLKPHLLANKYSSEEHKFVLCNDSSDRIIFYLRFRLIFTTSKFQIHHTPQKKIEFEKTRAATAARTKGEMGGQVAVMEGGSQSVHRWMVCVSNHSFETKTYEQLMHECLR